MPRHDFGIILSAKVLTAVWLFFANAPDVSAQNLGSPPDPLSSDIAHCPGPDVTPACALLTLSQCLWVRDHTLCDAVGADDVILYDGPWKDEDLKRLPEDYRGRLWGRHPPLYEVSDESTILGRLNENGVPVVGKDYYGPGEPSRITHVRIMDPSEFGRGDPIELRGTHTVVLSSSFEESSYIFRNDGDGWRIASIANEGIACVEVPRVLWDYLWHCKKLIGRMLPSE